MKINRNYLPIDTRVLGTILIDLFEQTNEGKNKKRRFVSQNYRKEGTQDIPTKDCTVQRFSQRILMSLEASEPTAKLFLRDLTQEYIQKNPTRACCVSSKNKRNGTYRWNIMEGKETTLRNTRKRTILVIYIPQTPRGAPRDAQKCFRPLFPDQEKRGRTRRRNCCD